MATTDLGKWMITNGGEYDPGVTYEKLTMVMYNNSTYITLQTVNGVEPTNDGVNYTLMAQGFSANALSDVVAQDTNGALGTAGQEVSAQSLVDWMTDQVMNQVLKKVDLVNNALATIPGQAALDSAMGKNFQDQINGINSNLGVVSTTLGNVVKPLTNTDIGAILGTMTRNASAIINDKLVCISVTILTPNDGIGIPADTPFFRINRKQVLQVCPVLTGGMQNAYVFTSITDAGDTVYQIRPGITQSTEIFMNFVGLVYR